MRSLWSFLARAVFFLVLTLAMGSGCQSIKSEDSLDSAIPAGEQRSYLETELEKLGELTEKFPTDPRHHYDIAAIQFEQSNYRESAASLRKAIDLVDGGPAPRYHYNLGRVHLRMHELEEAEREFRLSVEQTREERYSGPRAGLAYVLALRRKTTEAIFHFKRCAEIDQDNLEFYYFLGALHDMRGEDDLAIHNFREYLDRGGREYRTKAISLLSMLGVHVEERTPAIGEEMTTKTTAAQPPVLPRGIGGFEGDE